MDVGTESFFNRNFMPAQRYDYPSWLYVLVYLVVLVVSLVLNTLLVSTVWRQRLFTCPHLLLASLAFKDLMTTLSVIPFVVDSQAVRLMEWRFGLTMCKAHVYLDNALAIVHVVTLVALVTHLYVWMRKNEAYEDQQGNLVVRRSKMSRWLIPLSWVLGLGVCIPLIGVASPSLTMTTGSRMCVLWDGRDSSSLAFSMQLMMVIVTLVLALILILFPFVALLMQLLRLREPRIEGSHYRVALSAVLLTILYFVTRGPSDVYALLKLFHQSHMGLKVNVAWGTPYAVTAFETDILLSCLLYSVCMIDPILVIVINPDLRKAIKAMWNNLACNKEPSERQREKEQRRQHRQQCVPVSESRPAPILKRNRAPHQLRGQQDQPLITNRQPQIMPAINRPQQHVQQHQPVPTTQQNLAQIQVLHYPQQPVQSIPLQTMATSSMPQQTRVQQLQQAAPLGTPEFAHNPFPLPQEMLGTASPVFTLPAAPGILDTSLEGRTVSPQLPPVFEFDRFKYIDTARVEPKIGYSPDKTPPKTPETGLKINKANHALNDESSKRDEFTVETLESSPGRNLRTRRHRVVEVDEGVETDEVLHNSRRNSSTNSKIATITITGRTRSRTDLCPDVPRSKFEHSV